jgi:hypothetical protein
MHNNGPDKVKVTLVNVSGDGTKTDSSVAYTVESGNQSPTVYVHRGQELRIEEPKE